MQGGGGKKKRFQKCTDPSGQETIKNAQKRTNEQHDKNEERGPNPEKVEARRASARREGGRRVGAQNFALFFPLQPPFSLFLSLSGGLLVVFLVVLVMCTFGLSGCTPAAAVIGEGGPRGLRSSGRAVLGEGGPGGGRGRSSGRAVPGRAVQGHRT